MADDDKVAIRLRAAGVIVFTIMATAGRVSCDIVENAAKTREYQASSAESVMVSNAVRLLPVMQAGISAILTRQESNTQPWQKKYQTQLYQGGYACRQGSAAQLISKMQPGMRPLLTRQREYAGRMRHNKSIAATTKEVPSQLNTRMILHSAASIHDAVWDAGHI